MQKREGLRKWCKKVMSCILAGALVFTAVDLGAAGGLPISKVHAQETGRKAEDSAIVWLSDESLRPQAKGTECTVNGITFSHPGIYMSLEDLNTMQSMVAAGYDPWLSAFEEFRNTARGSKDCRIRNDGTIKVFGTPGNPARYDGDTAYAQTVLWYITGDSNYLNSALKILRNWYTSASDPEAWKAYENNGYGWSGEIITAGVAITKMCFAAEILRATQEQSGWTEEDTLGFTKFLDCAIGVCDRTDKFMNQTGYANLAMLSSAIFQNDAAMYREALMRFTVNENANWPWCDCSLTNLTRLVTEYWDEEGNYTQLEEEDYQVQLVEMGRDQPHAGCDVNILATVAQIVYTQGTLLTESGDIITKIVDNGDGTNSYYYDEYARVYNYDVANAAVTLDSNGVCMETLVESNVKAQGKVTDFYNYLDERLIKAVNHFAAYNLGNEVTWYPVRYEYSDLGYDMTTEQKQNGEGFVVGSSAVYPCVSTANRGRTNAVATLYYHYTYFNEDTKGNVPTKNYTAADENFKYISQMKQINGITREEQDYINNAELMIAPAHLAEGQTPQGAPKALAGAAYDKNTEGFDRILVSDCDSKSANSGIFVDYVDTYGATSITDSAYQGAYFVFRDYDLGEEELKQFILRSGSNSSQGCLLDVILLDDVDVANWNAVTEEEILSGEVVGEFWTGATGWWNSMKTNIYELEKALSGKHSFALYIKQKSDNVYNLCANLFWFAFADSYAFMSNSALDADVYSSGVVKEADGVRLSSGQSITYNNMHTDCGLTGLKAQFAATSDGRINVYTGETRIASYPVKSNEGNLLLTTLTPDYVVNQPVTGVQDITLEYVGDAPLVLKSIEAYVCDVEREEVYPALEAEDYTTLRHVKIDGTPVSDTEAYIANDADASQSQYLHQEEGATVVYYGVNTGASQLLIRYRSTQDVELEFRTNIGNGGYTDDGCIPFMNATLYNTNNQWKNVRIDLENEGVSLYSILYVTVKSGVVDVDQYSYNQENAVPIISGIEIEEAMLSVEDGGMVTDYLLKGMSYSAQLNVFDEDEEDRHAILVQGLDNVQTEGVAYTWIPEASGNYTYRVELTDGVNIVTMQRNIQVFDSVDLLIAALTEDYKEELRYSEATQAVYDECMARVQSLKAHYGQATANGNSAVEAMEELAKAISDLYLLDRYITLSDGGFANGMGDLQVLDLENLTTISDCNNSNNALNLYRIWIDEQATMTDIRNNGNGAGGYLQFDFGEGFGANLSKVYALARQDRYSTRVAGMVVQGSNDLYAWTNITNPAVSSIDWQEMDVTNNKTYRYLRVYNGAAWFGNLAEIRLCGQCVEHKIVDLSSYKKSLLELITELRSIEPYDYSVESYEEMLTLCSTAEAVLYNEDATKEQLEEQIAILTNGANVLATVDNELPLHNVAVTTSDERSGANIKEINLAALIDGKRNTFVEFHNKTETGTSGWGSFIIFDLGEDNGVKVSEVKLAAREDQIARIGGVIIEGSNDLNTWTTLTEGANKVSGWQTLNVLDEENEYRYLKLVNYNTWYGSISELRVYGAESVTAKREEALNILQETVTEAKAFTIGDYSVESFVAMYGALMEAETILAEKTESPTNIKAARQKLLDAIQALEKTDNRIDLAGFAVSASNGHSGANAQEAGLGNIFDGKIETFVDVRVATATGSSGYGGYIIFDSGENNSIRLETVAMAARNDNYYGRLGGAFLAGSNDGQNWVRLTEGARAQKGWQQIALEDAQNSYRYLKLGNNANWFGNIAELRVYGTVRKNLMALQQLVNETGRMTQGNYTDESWNALMEAYQTAANVLADIHATQEQIDTSLATLQNAINQLAEKEPEEDVGGGNGPDGDDPDGNEPDGDDPDGDVSGGDVLDGDVSGGDNTGGDASGGDNVGGGSEGGDGTSGGDTEETGVAIKGTLTSSTSDSTVDHTTTIKFFDANRTVIAQTTVAESQGSYSLANVSAGTYTLQVLKEDHATREYTVTVGTEAVTLNVEIWLKGDVNGDGDVTVKDKKVIFNHMEGTSILTDYAFSVGDVDGNGDIVAKDKKMIYNHIEGNALLWN